MESYEYKLCTLFPHGHVVPFFWKAEHDLAAQGNLIWSCSYIISILLLSVVAGGTLGVLLCFGISKYFNSREKGEKGQTSPTANSQTHKKNVLATISSGKFFLGSFLLIALAWLPIYLAYYPAICSYDTTIQMGQITTGPYIDHHPIAHTLLIRGSMWMGEVLFHSVNDGIAIYAFVQMIFLAAMFAYGITMLRRFKVRFGWIIAMQIVTMCYPFNWYMSVSTIKDTVFSGFFLLQILTLCELLLTEQKKSLKYIGFILSTVGMVLFRNNGKYALLVLLIFLLLCLIFGKSCRRFWGKLFACTVAGFLIGNVLLSMLFSATNAEQGDKREMLSMPIQQLARCMIYHGGVGVLPEDDNTMSETDKALVNDFLLDESYREYRGDISDPVKRHTNTYVVRYRAKEFITTYLHLFAEYPGDYVNAALAVNAGYLYPGDVTHAVINVNGRDKGLGYVQTRWVENELNPVGIYKDSKWESLHIVLEKWADENAYLKFPILKYLFVPGTFLWLYLLLACTLVLRRQYRMLLPLSLVAGYYVTLLLGPTVQLRYLYPVMIALPFMALLMFAEKERVYH